MVGVHPSRLGTAAVCVCSAAGDAAVVRADSPTKDLLRERGATNRAEPWVARLPVKVASWSPGRQCGRHVARSPVENHTSEKTHPTTGTCSFTYHPPPWYLFTYHNYKMDTFVNKYEYYYRYLPPKGPKSNYQILVRGVSGGPDTAGDARESGPRPGELPRIPPGGPGRGRASRGRGRRRSAAAPPGLAASRRRRRWQRHLRQ